ncbi:hypothetical protein [Roseobacter sp. CCS2]|uniref:hypothetical protein n=1 Tax=Roseobacter sp. CCS2 TaxID=391593 RepID=UPI00031FB08F|nr:hypothetical protein [Roseobacter sp. CCS2]
MQFNAEELAVIQERNLAGDIILERGYPADMSDMAIEKHASRGLGRRLLTAAVSGADANNFDLTVNKLMKGPDLYHFAKPVEAKEYEEVLKAGLVTLKDWIVGNVEVEKETASFEL